MKSVSARFLFAGMTNVKFSSLSDYRDVETINYYKALLLQGLTEDQILPIILHSSRDNARTPMQWSAESVHGGFTDGTENVETWIKINSNYKSINVEQALNDENSIFYYYQKLIELRRTMPIIVYGDYEILHEEHEDIFIYRRYDTETGEQLIIACNFSSNESRLDDSNLAEQLKNHNQIVISNYDQQLKQNWLKFRAYEAWAVKL